MVASSNTVVVKAGSGCQRANTLRGQTWFHSVSMAGVASQRTSPDSMAWAMGWAVGSLNTRQSSRALVSRMTMGGRAEAGKEGIGKAGKRSGSGVDDAAAQADLAVVEHGRLPGRDRP